MTIEIKGDWAKGFAYDVHTLGSVYLGVDESGHEKWDTTRSEMGELVYQLKNRGDMSAVSKIADLLEKYKGLETMDAIIPVPSTNKQRKIQPTCAVAEELGRRNNIPVYSDALEKHAGGVQLKNIEDIEERYKLLRKYMKLTEKYDLAGKNVLLLDDLYRSGATLTVATEILYEQARCNKVSVLTMTKTRRKR